MAYEPHNPADNNFVTGEPWFPVLEGDHCEVVHHPDRALFLCWPNYGEPWAAWALSCYKGDQLFYVGENEGGCCADDDFFEILNNEWEYVGRSLSHVTYYGIHCDLREFRRKDEKG